MRARLASYTNQSVCRRHATDHKERGPRMVISPLGRVEIKSKARVTVQVLYLRKAISTFNPKALRSGRKDRVVAWIVDRPKFQYAWIKSRAAAHGPHVVCTFLIIIGTTDVGFCLILARWCEIVAAPTGSRHHATKVLYSPQISCWKVSTISWPNLGLEMGRDSGKSRLH